MATPHSFSWLVPFNVGRACWKECRTVDRLPSGGSQLDLEKTTLARKKDFCIKRIAFFRKLPECTAEVEWWLQLHLLLEYEEENDLVWWLMVKSNSVLEPRRKRCHWSKESSLQGMASEQIRFFFAFVVHWSAKDHSPHSEKSEILGEFLTQTGFKLLASQKKCSDKLSDVFATNVIMLPDPSKTKSVS